MEENRTANDGDAKAGELFAHLACRVSGAKPARGPATLLVWVAIAPGGLRIERVELASESDGDDARQ